MTDSSCPGRTMATETRVLLEGIDEPELNTIDVYERTGGYAAMRKALTEMEPEAVVEELKNSGLRGRGGAGFSMGMKASFMPKGTMDKYLCCNADEKEAYGKGYLGENILGTGNDVDLVVHRGAGAYICGEETGLLDSLEGKRGNPRLNPPFPANQGLYQGPTLINNVETLNNVPLVIAKGADWFKSRGTEQSAGTKVVSVSGNVQRPGNYEIELGIS